MKIIDAFWEKRNLGLDTIEISLDETDLDNCSTILEALKNQLH